MPRTSDKVVMQESDVPFTHKVAKVVFTFSAARSPPVGYDHRRRDYLYDELLCGY
ncbi:hypothetical protein [Rubinisphaera sp.]|uniref:hypothetical protein n=1 Tax=Rubinisphaera sp. TaxID=2024857 RepID=UPI0025E6C415|nr:hypothetical protein [Rubinisphaera sp.]